MRSYVDKPSDMPVDPQRRTLLRAALGLGLSSLGGLIATPARANSLSLNHAAPPLVLHTLDGASISTSNLLGNVVIATFWASWCEPCRNELPLLSAFAEQYADHGLRVLGFSLDSSETLPEVSRIAETLSFPVGLIGSPWVAGYGRMWHIPVSFVIDRTGQLAYNGWEDTQPVWTPEKLEQIVGPMLGNI
jgi:thiol-disulfide isomerase/thioredoxin